MKLIPIFLCIITLMVTHYTLLRIAKVNLYNFKELNRPFCIWTSALKSFAADGVDSLEEKMQKLSPKAVGYIFIYIYFIILFYFHLNCENL